MKRLILVLGNKGGVGKTTFARFAAELLRHKRASALIVDGDGTVGQLLKALGARGDDGKLVYPQPREGGVATFSFHGDERDRDAIADMTETDAETVLIDLPAASLTYLERLESETGFLASVAERATVTIVSLITPDEETRRGLIDAIHLVPNATHVAVCNRHFGDEKSWQVWAQSPARATLVESGGIEVALPSLHERIADALKQHHVPYLAGESWDGLGVLDRGRVQRWVARASADIAPAYQALGLG